MAGFGIRGVVEGFYGRPWTMRDRLDIVDFMGRHGFNLYIYAPKDDELHRFRWRESYDSRFVKAFSEIVEKGSNSGVDVGIAISPGLTVKYSSDEDLNTLVYKYLEFSKMGVKFFALFYDDIPFHLSHEEDRKAFSSLAQAQASFANQVYERLGDRLPSLKFIVCPTEYHGRAESNYVVTLGNQLRPEIQIMWTGPQVCSQFIPESDALKAKEVFRREVLYWDNYPVNDGSMIPELHIGPYVGRDPEIASHSTGLVLNPMNQAHASMIALGAAADFLIDPWGYDATTSWVNSIKREVPELVDEMLLLGEYNLLSPIHPEQSERPSKIVADFRRLKSHGRFEEAVSMILEESALIVRTAERLRENLRGQLLEEMALWIYEFEQWGKLLNLASGILEHRRFIFEETPERSKLELLNNRIDEAEDLMAALSRVRTLSGGSVFRELVAEILIRTKGLLSLKEGNWK